MTREDVRRAWEEAIATGCGSIGGGVFIETGKNLNSNASEEEVAGYDDDDMYITTDNGIDPIYVSDVDDVCDELKDQIDDSDSCSI